MSHLLKLKRGHDESEEECFDDDNSLVTSGEEDYTDEDSFAGEITDEESATEDEKTSSEEEYNSEDASDNEQPLRSSSGRNQMGNTNKTVKNKSVVVDTKQVIPENKLELDHTQILEHKVKREVKVEQQGINNKHKRDNKREIDNKEELNHNQEFKSQHESNHTQVVDNQPVVEDAAAKPSQLIAIEEFTYTETVPSSAEGATQKRIQEHREYRRKLEQDPSFVPYVGLFWGHDDRYREDTLTETRPPSTQTEPRFSSTSGSNSNRATEYQRQLDPLMHKKWDHSGWEELLRLEEEDERRKRELIESGQLDSNTEYKSNHHHHHNRQKYPSRGRGGRGGHHHHDQRYPKANNRRESVPREEWPELNQAEKATNNHDASASWKNVTNTTNDWNTSVETPAPLPPPPSRVEDSSVVNAWGSVDRAQEIQPIVDNEKLAKTATTNGGTNASTIGTVDNGWSVPTAITTTPQIVENDWSSSSNVNGGWVEHNSTKTSNDNSWDNNGWGKPPTDVAEASKASNSNGWDKSTTDVSEEFSKNQDNAVATTITVPSNDDNTVTTSAKTDQSTSTAAADNGWNTTTTASINWNTTTTTTSQTTSSHWNATSSNQKDTRKGGWGRSPLKKDDIKTSSEEIPIEEKASSLWANITPDVKVSTTPSSWTRRNYNNNDRHSGRGTYTKSSNNHNDSTSHWKSSKPSSPAVTAKQLTQDWSQQTTPQNAEQNNISTVTDTRNESSGWGEKSAASTTTIASGWGETSIAVSTIGDVTEERSGWVNPSIIDTSNWTEQTKTTVSINNTTDDSSTIVNSGWDVSSETAAAAAAGITPSTITSPSGVDSSKHTETAAANLSTTTEASSGWGEPSITIAGTSGWGEPSTNVTDTVEPVEPVAAATPISTETPSSWNKPTAPASDLVQSSDWNAASSTVTAPEKTSDWNTPTTASTTKTTTIHSWIDSNVGSSQDTTKDTRSNWNAPSESSGWDESARKESAIGGWSNSRSNNSSNWNSDREANNRLKPNEQPPARKSRGYLSQKMESSIPTSPSPPTIAVDHQQENVTETSSSAWERFHQQGDSDSDVEIILEAEEEPEWLKREQVLGMTAPNDGAVQLQVAHVPVTAQSQSPITSNENSPRSKQVQRQYDSSSPRPESSRKYNSSKNARKPRRNFDDNWRQRDDHHQHEEQQLQYNNNEPAMYYPRPMNGTNITYVPMIPNANGNPMYAVSFPMGTSPTGQSISSHHDDNNRSSSPQQFYPSPPTIGPNGAIQLPPGYEANGMVYYGMDPSAMYPPQPFYYYAAPLPMGTGPNVSGPMPPPPPPPPRSQQMIYHPLPTEDFLHQKAHRPSSQQHVLLEEEDGWGPSPSIQDGEGEWSNNKKSSPLMDKSNSKYSRSNTSSPYYFYQ